MNLYDSTTHEVVPIPCDRANFRGEIVSVEAIAELPAPGRSGKLYVRDHPNEPLVMRFPGVVRAYLADAPREDVPA